MSQLDDTILDALTHVTFPKGFAQAEPAWVVTVDGVDYPLWQTDALVVGSGAAGLRAAVELKRRQQNVLIATAGLYMGTSACSGSDKQTLFTAATAGNGDNFTKLAEALASGGAMDHDTAYVEAVGSLHTLGGLQYLGLELPEDRYGAILRYQTDHCSAAIFFALKRNQNCIRCMRRFAQCENNHHTGNLIYISWLNGWPVNTPVNASPHTSRYATHDSGTLWIAGPSMVGDFHPLISTGLPAHTVFIYSSFIEGEDQ